jgi:hypothetical protein
VHVGISIVYACLFFCGYRICGNRVEEIRAIVYHFDKELQIGFPVIKIIYSRKTDRAPTLPLSYCITFVCSRCRFSRYVICIFTSPRFSFLSCTVLFLRPRACMSCIPASVDGRKGCTFKKLPCHLVHKGQCQITFSHQPSFRVLWVCFVAQNALDSVR